MSVELTIESYQERYSDFHKEVYNFRPRNDTSDWTLDDWKAEFESLHRAMESKLRDEAESLAMRLAGFDAEIAKLIALGAKDEATAIRWMADAENCTYGDFIDYEHLDYNLGVPFGTTKTRHDGNGKPMLPEQKRLVEINDEIRYMAETYSGCDWCCGGGDERMASLRAERDALITKLVV